MLSAWTVSIRLLTTSNFGLVASRISQQAQGTQGSVNRLATTTNLAAKAFDALGLAAAGATAIGIKGAADLQQSLARMAVQTGQSLDTVSAKYKDMMVTLSGRTGMSLNDSFKTLQEVSGVIKDPAELRRAMIGDPKTGGMMDLVTVLNRSGASDASAKEIARNVITVDHILNAYTERDMAHVNDRLYRSVVGSHMELMPLVTQIGYFGEQFRLASGGRAMAADDIFSMSELGYWGVGHGKWGAGLNQILRGILKPTRGTIGGLRALDLVDRHGDPTSYVQNARGEFTPMAMINHVMERMRGMTPMQQQQLISEAFSANAARMMAEATSPKTRAFIDRLRKNEGNMPDLMTAEGTLLNNLNDQTERLVTNFQNLATILEGPLTDGLTGLIKNVNDVLTDLISFFQAHPGEAKAAGGLMAGFGALTVAKLAGQIAKAMHVGGSIMRNPHAYLSGGTSSVATGIGNTEGILGRISMIGGKFLGALAIFEAIEFAIAHASEWGKVFGQTLLRLNGIAKDVFGNTFGKVVQDITKARSPMAALGDIINGLARAAQAAGGALGPLGNYLRSVYDFSLQGQADRFAKNFAGGLGAGLFPANPRPVGAGHMVNIKVEVHNH